MCGFLFSSFNVESSLLEKTHRNAIRRGPDHTSIVQTPKETYVHYLLHITGDATEQPIISSSGDLALVYNGEIYNYQEFGEYPSDGPAILDLYEEHGIDGIRKLDGEFSGVIHDKPQNKAIIFRDTFGTKPIYMAYDTRGLCVASYISQLKAVNYAKILKPPPNSILVVDLTTGAFDIREYRTFDLQQHKNHYEDWCSAFTRSIQKRTSNKSVKYFIGLSSGYDSGLIAATLRELEVDFNSYSIQAAEDVGTIHNRISLLKHNRFFHLSQQEYEGQQKYLYENCEPFETPPRSTRVNGYNMLKDKGAVGTGIICERAVHDGCRVYISGQGSDEIISDYGHAGYLAPGFLHSTIAGNFPDDLTKVFPWENFFTGTQEEFIAKDEHVGGAYGIETRYPFLDFELVQEFLWLTVSLKNRAYKAPIEHMMRKLGFPLAPHGLRGKVGFRANKHFRKEG